MEQKQKIYAQIVRSIERELIPFAAFELARVNPVKLACPVVSWIAGSLTASTFNKLGQSFSSPGPGPIFCSTRYFLSRSGCGHHCY